MGIGRDDSLRWHRDRSHPEGLGRWRDRGRSGEAGLSHRRNPGRLAGVPAGWPPFPLPVHRRPAREKQVSCAIARLQRVGGSRLVADAGGVRRSGTSAVRARRNARGAAVRSESHEGDRRSRAAGRAHRHGQRGTGAVLDLERRHAGLSHRRSERPAAVGGSDAGANSRRPAIRRSMEIPPCRPMDNASPTTR